MRNKSNNRAGKIWLMGLLTACILLCTCCGKNDLFKKEVPGAQKKRVTMVTKSTTSAFWKSVYSGANAASSAYNMELTFEGPDNEEDYETQNEMIYRAIQNNADAIVFSAVDYHASSDAIDEAAREGLKIVVIDSDVDSDQVECRIGTDNYKAGCMAGKALLEGTAGELKVGIVNFDINSENGQERERGFRDTVQKEGRVEIADTINVISTTEAADEGTKQMLAEDPQINAIVTFNEWTSLGVGYAIQELGLQEEVQVVAFDNNTISVGMLETGEVDALIVQNPYAMGYLGIETAYRLINGYPLDSEKVDTSTVTVTRGNMYTNESQQALFLFE